MLPRGVRSRLGRLAAALASALAGGCDDQGIVSLPPVPEIVTSVVEANPNNVLSAIVSAELRFADSVAVRYGLEGSERDGVTAAVRSPSESAVVPVLGLLPDQRYELQVVAFGTGGTVVGEIQSFTTGTLPADLPVYTAGGPDPSPGYVVFAAAKYGLVIDNTGRVVWYHRFPDGPGLNFMPQPTGGYVVRPPTPDQTDRELWIEIDPLGNVRRSLDCAGGLVSRLHDLIAEPDGAYWIMCDETRPIDLSALGGVPSASVTGTVVQHVAGDGTLLFQWNPFDHFAITDLEASERAGPTVNWTHGNAIDLDADGNLVVSFRNLGEVTKIDTRTGAVLWRMGGIGNQFTFEGTPVPAFFRQHGARLGGAGQLVLLDNLGNPTGSRAERYVYDEASRSARLLGSYGSTPSVTALLGGSTQALPGGRTLVSFGTAGRVEEYDAAGAMVWRIEGNPGYIFRAQRIRSLYRPE